MAVEIERKFLVANDHWKRLTRASKRIIQGYFTGDGDIAIRVRIVDDRRAFLTVKGLADGISRPEFEYAIPMDDAKAMLSMCGSRVLEKTRHLIGADSGLTWEVDEFSPRHAGLVIAEIELPTSDSVLELPEWIGEDVTGDPRYLNNNLARS